MSFIQENKRRWILVDENIVSKGNIKFSVFFYKSMEKLIKMRD